MYSNMKQIMEKTLLLFSFSSSSSSSDDESLLNSKP
jgi:hypothetical protein